MSDTDYKNLEGGTTTKATTYATAVPAEQQQQAYVPNAVAIGAVAGDAQIVTVVYISQAPQPQKMNFVRRVFGILTLQLLVTFGIVLSFFLPGCPDANDTDPTGQSTTIFPQCDDNSLRTTISESVWIIWVVLVAWLVIYIACVCAQLRCRKAPYNYIILSIFTLSTGVFLGVLSCYSSLSAVVMAIGLTILISVTIIGITCCSFASRGFVGPAPFIAVGIMAIFWSCCLFVPFAFGRYWWTYYDILYSGLGVLIFSLFLVYDTTVILNGTHRKIRFGIRDECIAALSLYLDIINLFICLLSGGRR